MADTTRLIEQNSDRATIYRWLGNFFLHEPSAEALDYYASAEGAAVLSVLSLNSALNPFVRQLQKLARLQDEAPANLLDLASAFASLFLGAGGPRSASPYASVYLSDKPQVNQQPAADMDRALRKLNIGLTETLNEPTDHVGIQLHLMAQYIDRESSALQEQHAAQIRAMHLDQHWLLNNHLLTWIPEFCRACQLFDETGFYRDLAVSLHAWLLSDLELLCERDGRSSAAHSFSH